MLKIHFLNVGHGDSAIIELPERTMMIDINNGQALDESTKNELMESFSISPIDLIFKSFNEVLLEKGYNIPLTNPIEYLKGLGINSIFRFILSHPHMDHMTGLHDLVNKENVGITNFWHSGVELDTPDFSKANYNEDDWNTYIELKNSDESPKNLVKNAGDTGEFWTDDGIEILCPTDDLKKIAVEKNRLNLCSYVLLITYKDFKFVLAGDAEKESWDYIVENYSDKISNVNVLKAAHHGRESGKIPSDLLKRLDPHVIVIGEALSEHLNYYTGYNTLTQNSTGDIVFKNESGKTHIFIEKKNYSYDISFLKKEAIENCELGYYLGTFSTKSQISNKKPFITLEPEPERVK